MCGLNDSCVATKGIFVQSAVDIGLIQPPIDYGTGPSPPREPETQLPVSYKKLPLCQFHYCSPMSNPYVMTWLVKRIKGFWQPFFASAAEVYNTRCLKITEKVSFNILRLQFERTTVHEKCLKCSILASFWKHEACGQTVIPDRSILIGQK